MKNRGEGLLVIPFFIILIAGIVGAEGCVLNAELINQDPYPAMPGEYVKVVFQLTGIENPECGKVDFGLIEKFPFSLDGGVSTEVSVLGGTHTRDFESFLMIPYKIRVNENALDGENSLEVRFSSTGQERLSRLETFNITVEDSRTDFEVSIKEYDKKTNKLTLDILNVGERDVEALTIEIPEQEKIIIKGPNRNIVGSLDSNDDTTFDFEAIPTDGVIKMTILYTDAIGVRRSLEKEVTYDSSYFTDRKADQKKTKSTSYYILIGLIIVVMIVWIRNRVKRKKKLKAEREKIRKQR